MKRYILLVLVGMLNILPSFSKEKEEPLQYEVICAGTGVEGTYLVNVSVTVSNPNSMVEERLRKAAIHGVLFQGVSASDKCSGYRPIVPKRETEQSRSDFFLPFFADNGRLATYADIVKGSLKILKMPKKQFRISATLSVRKDELRRLLEENKVIEGLSTLF